MYFPEDIWRYIKLFTFKTTLMLEYDNFVKTFNEDVGLINLKERFTGFERIIFNSWKITKQFRYIDLLRQQNDFYKLKKIFTKPY
jgi:hypothetical protein